ncbi:MAG: RHS repeat-associated core domain-containing protein [Clostridia bacterium]|nr:RHS repeat-associated core domain-containing protein [Clostridia bacterium]
MMPRAFKIFVYTPKIFHYDTLGNPLTYYDGTSFSWQGRQLVGAVKGTNTMSFTYNDSGLRTSKTVNGVTTEYYWNGNLLAAEKSPYYLIIYNYDASGRPIGMAYRESTYTQYQWDIYWFDLNLHGDVVSVYDNSGIMRLSYSYDAWGQCEIEYVNGGEFCTARKNRLAYRGYYYDTDLGLYYLQSRYYDPNTYRFISPDTLMSGANGSLHGLNLYVYCFNNPINMTDSQGNWPKWVEDAWGWVTDTVSNVGNFIAENVGVGVVQSQSYKTITTNTVLFGAETGENFSSVIAGDISKPISFYVSNASVWWKVWEYKIGMQVNINNGGFAVASGLGEHSVIASAKDSATEFSYGLNKLSLTASSGVDFGNRSLDAYTHVYIRTIPAAALCTIAYYGGLALAGAVLAPTTVPIG